MSALAGFVNLIAEGLKNVVCALLDILGKVIDTYLAAYQALINAALDVLEFIAVGIIKILEGLTNIVIAATLMPDQFMGQLSEEFLGMNVFEPLPFEKTSADTNDIPTEGGQGEDMAVANLLAQSSYTEDDFMVDPIINDLFIPSELLAQAPQDGEIEFGENQYNIEDFIASSLSEAGYSDTDASVGGNEQLSGSEGEMSPIPTDPYKQVDWFIEFQNSQGGGQQSVPDIEPSGAPATNDSIPDEMKMIGPLNPGARLYYLKEQMVAGIKKKWQENKVKYIAIGAAVVAGITALLIGTGGAILSVLPPAFQIFAAIMLGAAAVKAMGFFKQFLAQGFAGEHVEGAKGLARSIGIILVELLFILLFDSATLVKTLKTFAKSGIKGVVNLAKTAAKSTFKALGAGLKAAGKGFVRQASKAKFFVKNIGKNIGKGAKNFDDFGKRLATKFKFKGFKLKLQGFKFSLYGQVNPWVLIATGKVEKRKGPIGGQGSILDDAVVLNSRNNSNIAKVLKNNDEAGRKLFELLNRSDVRPDEIIKALDNVKPDEAIKLIEQLNKFKNIDEDILRRAIEDYRITSGIPKHQEIRPGTLTDQVTGGTVGTGKADFGHPDIDILAPNELMGRSPNAFNTGDEIFNSRYLPDLGDVRALNHAEQTIVGNLANKLDEVFEGVAKSDIEGTLKMTVDQPVCGACRHGLTTGVGASPIRKFSLEYPKATIIISAFESTEILIIKAGKILTK